MTNHQPTRKQLRKELRARRRALRPQQQRRASRRLCRNLLASRELRDGRSIALYWPNDGEIDPRPLRPAAERMNKTCYLPVLHPILGNQLWFLRVDASTRMTPNRFGIPEPSLHRAASRPAWALDVVLMPLVGFTAQGDRLGMGGGFYDRTFEFLSQPHRHKPRLIGLAHECQRVEAMPTASWDIPMDAIVTDQGYYPVRA
ncbi:5-formyltetrahydrofolate cyclo-ligase [Halomonadaceae bacterium KBTZ08]